MSLHVAYGLDLDDDMLNQLMYMEADAYAFYDSLNENRPNEVIIGAIPTETVKQFKRRHAKTLFLMKMKKTKGKTMLIGMACIQTHRSYLVLHTVYVKQYARKRGVGTALLKRAISIAKRKNMLMTLRANPLNEIAIRLYKKLGFKISNNQNINMEFDVK